MNRTEWKPEKYGMMGGLVWKPVIVPSGTQQLSFWLARAAPEAEPLLARAAPAAMVRSSWASDWPELPQKLSFWLVGEVQVKKWH